MRRIVTAVAVAAAIAGAAASPAPVAAQGGGCRAFGQNIAFLATTLGAGFGQAASGSAPLNDTVEAEQDRFCG